MKILRKFAFQILQKRAGKEGSSALAVLKGFVFVWEFEFSVATRNINHVPCKSHFQYKYLDISWSYGNTEFEFEIEYFAKSANALQNISLYSIDESKIYCKSAKLKTFSLIKLQKIPNIHEYLFTVTGVKKMK